VYEVELKVRADHETVRERLADRGAAREETVTQRDIYYDAPHRDFAETDEAFRLRVERNDEEVAKLTYKGPLVDESSKTREEHETTVGSIEEARAIVEGIGFDPAAVVEKERERYALDGFTVTLDDVTDLGEFVEIETEVATEAEVETARDCARELLSELGFDTDATIRRSYLGLLFETGEAHSDV